MKVLQRSVQALGAACLLAGAVLAHTGSGIAADKQGRIYFLDTGSGPWRIDEHGAVTRMPGPRYHWLALDANSAFADSTLPWGADGDIAKSGNRPTLLLSSDYPIAVGSDGNAYYPTRGNGGALRITRMLPSGATSILAACPATASGPLSYVNGLAAGPDGSIYYTENSVIRKITSQGEVSIVATVPAAVPARSIPGIGADSGPLLRGLAIDAAGAIYVAANGSAAVLKIAADGKATTLLQLESPWSPTAVALSGSDVIVLEYLHTVREDRLDWLPRVRRIAADGKSTILATLDQMPGARPPAAGGK